MMEAMAREIAVVATDVGGNSRLVADGHTGLLVPYGDPGALAQAIDRLLDDKTLRSQLASAGRALIESKFSLEKSGGKLLPFDGLMCPEPTAMIYNLHLLRALAALAVVYFHVGSEAGLNLAVNIGAHGVDVFFVISGFIIAYISARSPDGFFVRRLI